MMKRAFYLLAIITALTINVSASQSEPQKPEKIDLKIPRGSTPEIMVTYDHLQVDGEGATILLNDGSQWVIAGPDKEQAYDEISDYWRTGDEIRIGEAEDTDDYIIKNMNTNHAYLVEFICDRSTGLLITKVDKEGYVFQTEEGRLWHAGWTGSFKVAYWREGDRVIFNKSDYSKSQDYMAINTQDGSCVWVGLAW